MRHSWGNDDPIKKEMDELAQLWVNETDQTKKDALIDKYIRLDNHRLEAEKIRANGKINADTLFNGAVTIGLALLTLNFERFDILRSKVANLWLRRRG